MFNLAIANRQGDLYEEPDLKPLGRSGWDNIPLKKEDFIPLPPGSSISMLVDRTAIGRDKKKRTIELEKIGNDPVFPVAAILPPGFTRTYLPAYKLRKKARNLPFFAYTAMAIEEERMFCAAVRTHKDIRWDPMQYNGLDLPGQIKKKVKAYPKNRLIKHLSRCALEYKCFTAQNIFYDRWEGGVPVSSPCNARCRACISESRLKDIPAPQERIKFIPSVEEIVEISVPHLKRGGGIISFGQGCEGEPLLRGSLIAAAIRKMRELTDSGTININTNGSLPSILETTIDAGLDSVRISMNSAIKDRYLKYFKPKGYQFEDVMKSIGLAKSRGLYTSVNYLFLPGVNDREEERDAFFEFLEKYKVDMIQIRNFNIDPDYYFRIMPRSSGRALGVRKYLDELERTFPDIKVGSFSIPLR